MCKPSGEHRDSAINAWLESIVVSELKRRRHEIIGGRDQESVALRVIKQPGASGTEGSKLIGPAAGVGECGETLGIRGKARESIGVNGVLAVVRSKQHYRFALVEPDGAGARGCIIECDFVPCANRVHAILYAELQDFAVDRSTEVPAIGRRGNFVQSAFEHSNAQSDTR